VAAGHERPRRSADDRVVDAHEPVAHRAHQPPGQARSLLVVAIVGPHQAEEPLGIEAALEAVDALGLAAQAQVLGHAGAIEVVRVVDGKEPGDVAQHGEVDAVVRRRVGEHLVHETPRLVRAGVRILEKAPADKPAHRVGGQVDAEPPAQILVVAADHPPHLEDVVAQAAGVGLDLRALPGSDLAGSLVVVPVDEDAAGRGPPARGALGAAGVRVAVLVVLHQADQRRLEDTPHNRAVPVLSDLGRSPVETHVRRGHRLLHGGVGAGVAAHIDDRVVR
jgi:hypothetical protein